VAWDLLLLTKLEVLGALDGDLALGLALSTLHTQHDLLSSLSLLVENWLGLSAVSHLLVVVDSVMYLKALLFSTSD